MKITNLNSIQTEEEKVSTDNINNIGYGITKRLLEKYKPKDHYNIESLSNRINQKRVA